MIKNSKRVLAAASAVVTLGVAAAPLNTFATVAASDQHTDQLVVTVLPSCTFGSSSKGTDGGTPYKTGIEHDNSTGGYAADAIESITATSWDRNATAEATPWTNHPSEETNHHVSDVESTGYGILEGESGVTSTNNKANASYHTVHRTMQAGTTTDTFAMTKLWVVCNNGTGYSVTATATPLSDGESTPTTIPVNANYSATVSGYALKSITSTATPQGTTDAAGTAMTVGAETVAPTDETIIATHSGVSHEDGDSLQIVYGMGIATSQKADTYAGTVTYKLYKGVNGADNS